MTKQELLHLASLSKLEFADAELEQLCPEMDSILAFVSAVQQSDAASKDSQTALCLSQLRKDEAKPSFDRTVLLQNAPEQQDGCFVVPQVVE